MTCKKKGYLCKTKRKTVSRIWLNQSEHYWLKFINILLNAFVLDSQRILRAFNLNKPLI